MFINYLENTTILLIILIGLILLLPKLRTAIIRSFLRVVLTTYFGEGVWFKRNTSSSKEEKEELVHLMYAGRDEFVITRTTLDKNLISVDVFTLHNNQKFNLEKQIIIPR